ncbi:MAG: peptidoglycan bridge formation glycyltransferase FemA/FemB family protein [Candidatus Buchananbacteria bacterium]|nr:peptidoglycan bridge formation glycyltransferase FemA/FemB family protein [Candidatus Buchananbacteria bacterium]
MNIITAQDDLANSWDEFVKNNAQDGGLLQSWRWGDFQKNLDHTIFRLAMIDDDGQIKAAALLVRHELPFEYNYLYCPRGPVVSPLVDKDSLDSFFAEVKNLAHQQKSFMIRIDPAWSQDSAQKISALGFRLSDDNIQPKCAFIVNINRSEEEILAGMKQKTRYNIVLAQKKGVQIKISREAPDMEVFWALMKQTAKRDGFKPHLKDHYKKLFDTFKNDQTIQLVLAECDGKIVAAAMVSFFGRFATYLHGASSDLYRGAMAPYLLHWQAILEAKRLDCHYYDFGGVNGQSFYDEKWEGITRFKNGFAQLSQPKEYVGNYEIVLNPFVFAAYRLVKQVRD